MFSELFFPDSKKLVVPYDRDAHARTHICGGSMVRHRWDGEDCQCHFKAVELRLLPSGGGWKKKGTCTDQFTPVLVVV